MAVRSFDGVDDVISCGVGACAAVGGGAFTLVFLAKLTAQNGAPFYLGPVAGGSSAVRIVTTPFSFNWNLTTDGSTYRTYAASPNGENWTLVAVTKAAGVATPRGHRYVYDTDTWTHADGSGTNPDGSATGEIIHFGHFRNEAQFYTGLLAAVGLWDTVLTDLEIEGLTTELAAWAALAPLGLWAFNQDDVGTAVEDLTGNGADQSAITGTAVVVDDPPGFTFDLALDPAQLSGVSALAITAELRSVATMGWAPDYITVRELANYLRIVDTYDDVELAVDVTAASRAIDNHCNRQFGLVSAAEERTYVARYDHARARWVVDVDDLMTTADMVVEIEGTVVTTFVKEPLNAAALARPWTRLAFDYAAAVVPVTPDYKVVITARWGWLSVPVPVTLAARLQASRFNSRREAPFGIAGSPEAGSELRLLDRVDPDVAVSLKGFVRPRVVG